MRSFTKLRFLITLPFLMVTFPLLSQEKYTISGYVKDDFNGESLIGASVNVNKSKQGTITN